MMLLSHLQNTPVFLGTGHVVSRVLHRYADWRIAATDAEKRCHKSSASILLTFDDYGTEAEVRRLLSTLADKRVKAMFFLVGAWAKDHPDIVQLIQDAGHVVGNHTTNHPNLLQCSDEDAAKEIIGGLSGRWLRAPQGRANRRIRRIAASLGFSLCYWTIDSRDWTTATTATIRHTILSELHPGAVILFHIHGRHTGALLPNLIDDIRARGYQLTDFSENW